MRPQSRSLPCKAIIISLSICLGLYIAFMLFKFTQQEPALDVSTVQEIKPVIASPATDQDSQAMIPTDEELQKTNVEIEEFRLNMTQEQRDELDKQVEELAKPIGEYSWIPGLTKEELEDYLVNATEEQRKKYEEPIKEFLKSLEEHENSSQPMIPSDEELQNPEQNNKK